MKTIVIFAALLLVLVVSTEGKTFELVPLKLLGKKPNKVYLAKASNDDPDDPKPEGRFFVEILAALKGALVGGGIGGLAGAALSNSNWTAGSPTGSGGSSSSTGSGAQCIILGGRSLDHEDDDVHHVQFIQRGESRQATSPNTNCIIVTKKKPATQASFPFNIFSSFQMPGMTQRRNLRKN